MRWYFDTRTCWKECQSEANAPSFQFVLIYFHLDHVWYAGRGSRCSGFIQWTKIDLGFYEYVTFREIAFEVTSMKMLVMHKKFTSSVEARELLVKNEMSVRQSLFMNYRSEFRVEWQKWAILEIMSKIKVVMWKMFVGQWTHTHLLLTDERLGHVRLLIEQPKALIHDHVGEEFF